MTVHPLSEGSFTIDHTKRFIPFDPSGDRLAERPRGSLLVEIQPFVVVTGSDVVLLDTGLGQMGHDGILQIHHNLARVGIDPTDVTLVLLSHLHADHAGGVGLDLPILGERRLSFPNAHYAVQRQELEHAFRTGGPSYRTSELEVLASSDRLLLLEGDGELTPNIRYALSGGHAPYHQVFWLQEGGRILFFGGDEAPQLQQMKHRFVAKYDYDGRRAMEWRSLWWEQGKKDGWLFLFYHDIAIPMAEPAAGG
jgi:glyoxylase-like metal-dependent hydrolase (beta-lactamase superfamily II)